MKTGVGRRGTRHRTGAGGRPACKILPSGCRNPGNCLPLPILFRHISGAEKSMHL